VPAGLSRVEEEGRMMSQSAANLVTVRCPCGAKLRVKPEGLGRKARCPKCNDIFVVTAETQTPPKQPSPAPTAPDSLLDELAAQERTAAPTERVAAAAGARACPQCGSRMPGDALLCVSCGYNLQTGRSTRQASAKRAALGGAVRNLAKRAGTFALGCTLAGVAALLGAGVWCMVALKTGYEIGWIAWGLGGAVGFAMAVGYREHNTRAGVAAAGIAAIGVFGAKVLVFFFVLRAILTGDTSSRDLQREFLRQSITEEILDDREAWSEEERDAQWDSAYKEAEVQVKRISDQGVEERVAELRAEEEQRTAAFAEGGLSRTRLASARAMRRAEERGVSPTDPLREHLYDEELERIKPLSPADLEDEVAELDRWGESDERWQDEVYVRNRLVYQLIEQDMAHRAERDDETPTLPRREWEALHAETCAQVDALSHDERCARSKGIEHDTDRARKRSRIAYHRTELEELGQLYDGDRHDALLEKHTAECATMTDAELDAAIADIERWDDGAKWEDPAYVRDRLIALYADEAADEHFGDTDSDTDEFEEPGPELWKAFHEAAAARADAVPEGERLARVRQLEESHDAKWAEAQADAQWQETSEMSSQLAGAFFTTMFGPIDLLFILLALGSAYRIAGGGTGTE
jgi:hypothetical protein